MICLEAQYFNLNRILLQAIGCWPFQQSKLARIQFCLFSNILTTGIIFQLTSFATSKCTPKFLLKVLSSIVSCTIAIVYYSSFYINIETVRNLLTELHDICNQLKDANEIAIIKRYGYKGKHLTTALLVFYVSLMSTFLVSQFCPTSKSRSRRLFITMEYFLDEEKYFYLIIFHINMIICIGLFVLIAIGAMSITYLQHTCGMFRIARLSTLIISNFDSTYFILVIIAVISLSLNLFQITISTNNISETVIAGTFISVILMIFFLGNYIGQLITDYNNHVFATAYNVQWYIYPLRIQKLILFLLQRSVKELHLTCGGLFDASFECFAMLIKVSGSYFTVIYSME